ncbi:MAG: SDR family NAD(P)-dependent oxidoreductase [Deltaproteobacteria bacterium]|nr:SDR family NAD(P)-dependent oxidoreductase [Deltaproteobacteria bacterium]
MSELRYDGRVAIVTGAGNGLGRSHALLLASRGCKVVVNDLGGAHTGGGKSSEAADRVVSEIKAAGGEAVANYDSVEDGVAIVKSATDAFGRLDIVINNAGILRDTSFQKMSEQDWDLIYRVHVLGAYRVTAAAWNLMRDQGYGRLIFTASAAGIYGNFGQANYAMAKLGLVGFANTLAIEGKKKNVLVNTIAPIAGSRMTETVLPKELLDALEPGYVSPLVAFLAHESCEETGSLFEVGGGVMNKLRWERTVGKSFPVGRPIAIEQVKSSFAKITDFSKSTHPTTIQDSLTAVLDNVQKPSKGGNEFIDVDQALGFEFPKVRSSYDSRDVALYALGVGAGRDPMDASELAQVYEAASEGMRPLPTMTAAIAVGQIMKAAMEGVQAPGMNYGLDRILHGEQYTKVIRPLPPEAKLEHRAKIKDIWDKGKGAVVVTEIKTYDDSGSLLAINEVNTFVRGAGGWGGERGPNTDIAIPERAPDFVVEEKTDEGQALLYRLSGDINPLHADPGFAAAFGFNRPILHGLCTFGFAARHVVKAAANNDPRLLSSIRARFADPVIPGETLVTEGWRRDDGSVVFRCKAKERDKVVLTNAVAELHKEVPKASVAPSESKPATSPGASKSTEGMRPTEAVFSAMGEFLAENPAIAKGVGKVYLFKITGPDSVWTVDLKNGAGSVSAGVKGAADCTLELTDTDWMAMASGAADPMKLYLSKQLKISGDLMASQKLDFLKKIDPEKVKAKLGDGNPATSPGATQSAPESPAGDVFIGIADWIAKNPEAIGRVGKKFLFVLTDPSASFVIDVKNAPGSAGPGAASDADCTLTLATEDFMAMTSGKADPQQLYFGKKLAITGDLMASQKLSFLKKIDPEQARAAVARAKGGAVTESAKGPSKSAQVRAAIAAKITAHPGWSAELGGAVTFALSDGDKSVFTVDDKGVSEGRAEHAKTTVTLGEDALWALAKDAKSAALYQHGELRVDGLVGPAHKLSLLNGLLA